ncbi:hypothetical protein C0583_00550 [Candidatus Parcubacteria bacterium]|nr:MAG: hypothetical protein C0583_00550 [Candidatus Parcubacteria bacterium]
MKEKGSVSIIMILLIMGAMISASFGIHALVIYELKVKYANKQSIQAYYIAESGIEDAVYRLVNEKNLPDKVSLVTDLASTTVSIIEVSTSTKSISAVGFSNDRYRNLSINVYNDSTTTEDVLVESGMASGIGGIILENSCVITGNVTANGNVFMENTSSIVGDLYVAKNSNKIFGDVGATITGNAKAYTCEDVTVNGSLDCMSSTCSQSCAAWGGEIPEIPLTITTTTISHWKDTALSGGTQVGDWDESGGTYYVGPKVIDGNMRIRVNAKVVVTGTIWVTGNLTIANNAEVYLDTSYGSSSGAIVFDGIATLDNTAKAFGSGHPKSFMIIASDREATSTVVIDVDNSFAADILAAPQAWVKITNSTGIKHVTAYGIHLRNGAELVYDSNISFFTFIGGGGGNIASSTWNLYDWQETE